MLRRTTAQFRIGRRRLRSFLKKSFLPILFVLTVIRPSPSGSALQTAARLPDNLDPLVRSYPPEIETALKALKSGVGEYEKDRHAAALALLPDPTVARQTPLADIVLAYRGKCYIALGKPKEALKQFKLLRSRFPASSQEAEAAMGEAQALLELGQPAEARDALRTSSLESTSEMLFLSGRILEAAGKRSEAIAIYLRLYSDFVASRSSSLARERLQVLAPRVLTPRGSFRVLLQRADNLLTLGKNTEARTLLLKMNRADAPAAVDFEKRNLLLAAAEVNRGRTTTALTYLDRVSSADPSTHARALFLRATSYRRLEREESFLRTRDTALTLHPQSPWTEKLLYSVATYYDVDHRLEQAYEAYRSIVERFPKGEHAPRALWKSTLITYVKGDYQDALRQFWNYLLRSPEPSGAASAIYWMGRCYEKLGDIKHALYLYGRAKALGNENYYGQRAGEAEEALTQGTPRDSPVRGGLDFDQVVRVVSGLNLPFPVIPEPSTPGRQVIERARQLTIAGLPDLALAELRWGTKRLPNDKALGYVAARIYESADDHYGVIATLRRTFPNYDSQPANTLPGQVWELLFPIRHWKVISQESEKHGIDGNLVLSLIRQESAFKETARSSANARGLMQVLPSTGRRLAREAGIPRYATSKLYRPDTNIPIGIRHLSSLLQRYNRRVELVLAAYNAGEHRVDRWLQDFGNVDGAEFTERIPFSETRSYVRQVLTNMAHYRRLTAPSPSTAN